MVKRIFESLAPIAAIFLIVTAFGIYERQVARGSDHQETPLAATRAGADITDLFVFPAADPNNVVFAMDVHALIPRGMGPLFVFDPGVMYQFKISTDGGARENKVVQFRAVGTGPTQRLEMYGPATPAAIGTRSRWVGSPQRVGFGRSALGNGITVFAGARKDPFFFDLAQFLKVAPDRFERYHDDPGARVPPPTAKCFRSVGRDFFGDFNVLSLIVEMPRKMLVAPNGKLGVIHVYATASLMSSGGQFVQVQRLGRPAVKEAFEAFANHDPTDRQPPWNDKLLADSIVSFTSTKPPNGAGRSMQLAKTLRNILIPDELFADLSSNGPAGYLGVETKAGNFGGRGPSTQVINPSLSAIFGNAVAKLGLVSDDHAETPCLTNDNLKPGSRGVTNSFPYLGSPI